MSFTHGHNSISNKREREILQFQPQKITRPSALLDRCIQNLDECLALRTKSLDYLSTLDNNKTINEVGIQPCPKCHALAEKSGECDDHMVRLFQTVKINIHYYLQCICRFVPCVIHSGYGQLD
jgi:hypothetical protein